MANFEELVKLNSHIPFYHVRDTAFHQYGKIIPSSNIEEIESFMNDTEIPLGENIYVPSIKEMEQTAFKEMIETTVYGEMPIQIGYCNGRNSFLNGFEYHKGSEINIAITDFVLLLGRVQDIEDKLFSSENVEAFFIPKGTMVELYSTTLHFAPCKVSAEGFKAVVILLAGTNQSLDGPVKRRTAEDELLFMKNKWLIAHPERKPLIDKGAYPGIKGKNIEVQY
ncbi:DUF4867 family protein [Neobacillus mesonae]|uniref:DUF4867 family protein n=1 Tax=Neobacillus mesonae TaxID=1193713 RepID=UPI00203E7210|nr:DUF4867 family protein [Neobacillus mesonae]MCM3570574.1 DUF4867 family protein [Neobacillus mesonae]